jgi:diguanylate cyclase (GGDEF)-like protein
VSDRIHFEQQAGDWLVRAKRDKEQLVLLTLAVDGLGHINSAFGKEFGDDTIYTVGRITCRYAPGAALIAHTGGGRFLMLTTSPTIGSPKTIAERIQTALVETPVDRIKGIRAIATFGVASTEEAGYELSELATLATGALNEAKTIQPGTIVLSSTLQ